MLLLCISIQLNTKEKKEKNCINIGSKLKLELISVKELQTICSKSLNDNFTYRMNNYTKMKKVELLKSRMLYI